MKRVLPAAYVAMSVLLAAGSLAAVAVAAGTKTSAAEARSGIERVRAARLEVARAQEALGGSDLNEAVASARRANRTARRVAGLVERMNRLLEPTADVADRALSSAERGARNAIAARRQTEIAAATLGAISGYQAEASKYSHITNRALARILRALRRTNEEFDRP